MNENGTKRREWVKNAAIVFLALMLVLTFFSNTFMNYSLPEVAAQYVQPGTITAKIRGSGTVESGDPYNIQINETRTVESINVRVGDTVQKGDVLFVLADKESSELKAAEDALKSALLDFELQILSGNVSTSAVQNVQNGKVSSTADYQKKIAAAEAKIEKCQAEVDAAQEEINWLNTVKGQLNGSTPDTSEEERALAAAQAAFDANPVRQTYIRIEELDALIKECEAVIAKFHEKIVIGYQPVTGGDPVPIYEVTDEEYMIAASNRENYVAQREPLVARVKEPNAEAEFIRLRNEVNQAKENLEAKKNSVNESNASISDQLANWNLELTTRQKALTEATTAKNQLLADIAAELNLNQKLEKIKEQEAAIEELRNKATESVITAPINGTITSINVASGKDTVAGSAVATMQPEGQGYTMSFSVTNEQAKKLSPGVQAELVNSWRYDDVVVTLKRIKPDPSNPSQNKILEFDVTGSVIDGQSLNISVGDKSANYDMTVPNSAIREDSNGKFVLIVEAKPSPLGNRYKATRVDVEVVASDDTTSAVTGAMYSYEYVITTSTKPITAGQLVRLAEQ